MSFVSLLGFLLLEDELILWVKFSIWLVVVLVFAFAWFLFFFPGPLQPQNYEVLGRTLLFTWYEYSYKGCVARGRGRLRTGSRYER